ncbi:hypothetical protein LSH36_656g01010 [Paralvinella palmiformis]|uniref:Uncharacterized protein n=1 Tax=Paralvinella palmiformis TaxID=53620 RepID=A0AAD9MU18_9ANNE|nr:hypothetical protein LSH36_656g01010 [Paralvinella palmiformis]
MFRPTSEVEVKEIIIKYPNKSFDLDPLPTWLLKKWVDQLLPLITAIVNWSMDEGNSTETTLLNMQSRIAEALDEGTMTALISTDKRLEFSFGIREKALTWVKSYIAERTQGVSVADKTSLDVESLSIKFRPDNDFRKTENLTDNSSDTCFVFYGDTQVSEIQYTTFRINTSELQDDYIKVSLIGKSLGCGHNLHVIPLTKPQTEMWTGIWLTCDLMSIPVINENESCIFRCHCLGGCEEIQITKIPRTPEERSWSLCHIDIVIDSSGI